MNKLTNRIKSALKGIGKKQKKQAGGIIESIFGIMSGVEQSDDSIQRRVLANAPNSSDIRNTADAVKELERRQGAELMAKMTSGNPGTMIGAALETFLGGKGRKRQLSEMANAGSKEALSNYLSSAAGESYKKGGKVKKGGIHIKPENKGKFTAYKKRTGKTTTEALHSKNPHVRQMANFARNAKKWHHVDGGLITGKGTEKSDSVEMKAAAGAFIVPAENKTVAQKIGKEMLGWNEKQKAKKTKKGVAIMASKNEIEYTPDEVAVLLRNGIDINKLAPNAESKIGMKKGGKVSHSKKRYKSHPTAVKAAEMRKNPPGGQPLTAKQDKYFKALEEGWTPGKKLRKKYQHGGEVDYGMKGKLGSYAKKPSSSGPTALEMPKNEWLKKLWDYTKEHSGELAGIAQAAGAGISLLNMPREPELTVSDELRQVNRELKEEAQYGLEPFAYNEGVANLIRTRNESRRILSAKGLGSQELQKALSLTNEAFGRSATELRRLDVATQKEKKNLYLGSLRDIGARKDVIELRKLDKYKENEAVLAEMLRAGLENIGGAKQYRDTLKALKDIQGTNFG